MFSLHNERDEKDLFLLKQASLSVHEVNQTWHSYVGACINYEIALVVDLHK